MLLSIDKLNAIQWVYGDGKPGAGHWIDTYKSIEESGKGIHVLGNPDKFLEVYSQVKKGLFYSHWFSQKDREAAQKILSCK